MKELKDGYLETERGRLHYLQWPNEDGLPAHFLHGNGMCAGAYTPFLRLLSERFDITASDVRGQGDSELKRRGRIWHWGEFTEDLKRVIEAKMKPPVIGMGHSLGSVITAMAAARYPHLFSRLVLIDPVFLPARILWLSGFTRMLGLGGLHPLAQKARRRKRVFAGKGEALERFTGGRGIFKTWSAPFIESYLECALEERGEERAVLKCDPEVEAQFFESVPLNTWSYIRKIQCPVLVLRGENSDTFLPEAAERVAMALKDGRVVTIGETTHFLPMERAEACVRVIFDGVSLNMNFL